MSKEKLPVKFSLWVFEETSLCFRQAWLKMMRFWKKISKKLKIEPFAGGVKQVLLKNYKVDVEICQYYEHFLAFSEYQDFDKIHNFFSNFQQKKLEELSKLYSKCPKDHFGKKQVFKKISCLFRTLVKKFSEFDR